MTSSWPRRRRRTKGRPYLAGRGRWSHRALLVPAAAGGADAIWRVVVVLGKDEVILGRRCGHESEQGWQLPGILAIAIDNQAAVALDGGALYLEPRRAPASSGVPATTEEWCRCMSGGACSAEHWRGQRAVRSRRACQWLHLMAWAHDTGHEHSVCGPTGLCTCPALRQPARTCGLDAAERRLLEHKKVAV